MHNLKTVHSVGLINCELLYKMYRMDNLKIILCSLEELQCNVREM